MNAELKQTFGSKLSLGQKTLIGLCLYFLILLIGSLYFGIKWVLFWDSEGVLPILAKSLIFSILGSSIYYLRKIYKNAINKNFFNSSDSEYSKTGELGTFFYYFTRPLFSMGFVLIYFIMIKAEIHFIVDSAKLNQANFSGFMMVSSFFIGLTVGRFIEKMLNLSHKYFDKNGPI